MAQARSQTLPLAELVRIADLHVEARAPRIGVLGGEPTLHPDFVDLLLYLLSRGLRVTVFTNGLASDDTIAALSAIAPEARVRFVVNVNYPEITPTPEAARQRAFLQAVGRRAELGLNLFRLDLDPSFVARLGEECAASGRVRLGLALPVAGTSESLPAGFYQAAAPLVVKLVLACSANGGTVHFDCGFPRCMFDDRQLAQLREHGTTARFTCEPALDIAPGGETWACFPLHESHRIGLAPGTTLGDLRRRHRAGMQRSREESGRWGIRVECRECVHREARRCDGGCLALALRLLA